MFGRKNNAMLGLDISTSMIKLLELGQKKGKHTVVSYATEVLPDEAVIDGKIVDLEVVVNALKRAIKQSGTKVKEVAIAIPTSVAVIKTLSFPLGLSEREVEEQVMLEAENYIPYPIEDVMLDFEVIGVSDDDDSSVDVLLVATQSEYISILSDVAEDAGLKLKLVDVSVYAMENTYHVLAQDLPNHGQGLTVALVDIGASTTTLNVLVDGKSVFSREHAFGGRILTEEIAQQYGMSHQEAEKAKKENKFPESYESELLTPFKQTMTTTVTRALQFFFSASTQYQSIDHIILAGGCASIKGIAAMIEENTDTVTSVANPFGNMVITGKAKNTTLANDSPSLLTASGLALRGGSS